MFHIPRWLEHFYFSAQTRSGKRSTEHHSKSGVCAIAFKISLRIKTWRENQFFPSGIYKRRRRKKKTTKWRRFRHYTTLAIFSRGSTTCVRNANCNFKSSRVSSFTPKLPVRHAMTICWYTSPTFSARRFFACLRSWA